MPTTAAEAIHRQSESNSIVPATRMLRKGTRYALIVEGLQAAQDWAVLLRDLPTILTVLKRLADVVELQEQERRKVCRALRLLGQGRIKTELATNLKAVVQEVKKDTTRVGRIHVRSQLVEVSQEESSKSERSVGAEASSRETDKAISGKLTGILGPLHGIGLGVRWSEGQKEVHIAEHELGEHSLVNVGNDLQLSVDGQDIEMAAKDPVGDRAASKGELSQWLEARGLATLYTIVGLVMLDRLLSLLVTGYP